METPILSSKLHVPAPRPDLVARPRLLRRLDEGLRRQQRLTLIAAPAGFGKTTLLAAWLSLDEEENDPGRFLTYLLAALGALGPNVGQAAKGLLGSPQAPPLEALMATLVNDLATLPATILPNPTPNPPSGG
jgi:LuxR family maltose regulon positive regulatory protein